MKELQAEIPAELENPDSGIKSQENESLSLLSLSDKTALFLSRTLTKDKSESGSYEYEYKPGRALRKQCEFTQYTKEFLQRYKKQISPCQNPDGSTSYFIPMHGISSRVIGSNHSYEPKYFRSVMEVRVAKDAHNLDQCSFKRGPRIEESKAEFENGIDAELNGSESLLASRRPLNFFTHGAFSSAGVSDADALRLAMLSGIPTVSVDWRSTEGAWYTLPMRYVVDYNGAVSQEKQFEKALDAIFDLISPENGTMVSFSRGAAFNNEYMKHRFLLAHGSKANAGENQEQFKLNGHVLSHADLNTSEFKLRVQGFNPLVESSANTVVLGNRKDKALFLGKLRIFGDRVGDGYRSDIEAVNAAGGKYVIDEVQKHGGNFNHYVNYSLIARLLREMSDQNVPDKALNSAANKMEAPAKIR